MNETRLFFVVDTDETNEEIFETLEDALEYAKHLSSPRVTICLVKNAYKERMHSLADVEDFWTYKDRADTFTVIKTLS